MAGRNWFGHFLNDREIQTGFRASLRVIKEEIRLSWLKYTLKRLLMLIPVIICVTFILYVILSFAPGNVAWQILGEDATAEQIAQLEAEMGLDKPLLVRYGNYMLGVCHLDFGTSWFGGEDIAKLFLGRLPYTLLVAVLSILFAVGIGCPLGIGSAIKQYSLMDYGVSFVAMLLTSMPAFWLGTMCQIFFCLTLNGCRCPVWVPGSTMCCHRLSWVQTRSLP